MTCCRYCEGEIKWREVVPTLLSSKSGGTTPSPAWARTLPDPHINPVACFKAPDRVTEGFTWGLHQPTSTEVVLEELLALERELS